MDDYGPAGLITVYASDHPDDRAGNTTIDGHDRHATLNDVTHAGDIDQSFRKSGH
jgi:hypothetical protein